MERRSLIVLGLFVAACTASVPPLSTPTAPPGERWIAREYRPEGPGPFPAIVLMHGCSGLWARDGEPTALYRAWAELFSASGYLVVLTDSFRPRGEREVCTQYPSPVTPQRDRPRDAFQVLQLLATRPDVDADRIYLMGWSHGGSTVLNTLRADLAPPPGKPRFRAAVAMYPGCRSVTGRPYAPWAPLLIQSGAADDWTPAALCRQLVAESKGAPLDFDVYPGAGHAFDAPGMQVHFRPEVRNASSPTGWGATVGSNPEARDRAVARVTDWLAAH